MTENWVVQEIKQHLRDSLRDLISWSGAVKNLEVNLASDGASVVVSAGYSDGRTGQTVFEGDVEFKDVDDIVAVMVEEITENAEEVLNGTNADEDIRPPFPMINHTREPAPTMPWEGGWMPGGPIPSIRNQEWRGGTAR